MLLLEVAFIPPTHSLLNWLSNLVKFHLKRTINPLTQYSWALNPYHITSGTQLHWTVQWTVILVFLHYNSFSVNLQWNIWTDCYNYLLLLLLGDFSASLWMNPYIHSYLHSKFYLYFTCAFQFFFYILPIIVTKSLAFIFTLVLVSMLRMNSWFSKLCKFKLSSKHLTFRSHIFLALLFNINPQAAASKFTPE